MYIYNVTININETVQQEWLTWMKTKHIPDMLATGKFLSAKMCQVLITEEMGGITYSVQYTIESLEKLHQYYKEDANKMRAESTKKFNTKFVAFRTELKIISEQFSMATKN